VTSIDEDGEDVRELDKEWLSSYLAKMEKTTKASKAKTLFKAIVKETEMELKDILPLYIGLMVMAGLRTSLS